MKKRRAGCSPARRPVAASPAPRAAGGTRGPTSDVGLLNLFLLFLALDAQRGDGPCFHALDGNLLAALKTIALREKLNLRRQTLFVSRGGWDHHSALITPQQNMLSELSPALAAFQTGLENLSLADSVITFSASDFARTLRSNGSGSDHAWGGNQFVMGAPVAGGQVLGQYPDLALDSPNDIGRGGRILPTTSVDQLFAELLLWFGLEGSSNFDAVLPNLPYFYNLANANAADPTTLPIGFLKPNAF